MPERWLSLLRTGGSQTPEPVLNLRRNIQDATARQLELNWRTVDHYWDMTADEYSGAAEPRFRPMLSHRSGRRGTTLPVYKPDVVYLQTPDAWPPDDN